MNKYRSLASLQNEIKKWEEKVYEIDRFLNKNSFSMTQKEIMQKKQQYKEPHKHIASLKNMIYNGEYIEAQNKLY